MKMTVGSVHVRISPELQERARRVGLSVTGVCRKAVLERVEVLEKWEDERSNAGAPTAKQSAPTAPFDKGNHSSPASEKNVSTGVPE